MSAPEAPAKNHRHLYFVFFLAVTAGLCVALREVLMVVMAGIVLGVVLSFPVGFFSRRIPRGAAVILTLLLGSALIGGVIYLGFQPLSEQFAELKQNLPRAMEKVKTWTRHTQQGPLSAISAGGAAGGGASSSSSSEQGTQQGAGGGGPATPPVGAVLATGSKFVGSFVEIVSGIIVVIVLAAFFSHEPGTYREGVRALVPRRAEGKYDSLWRDLRDGLRHWVGGILISMTLMGALTAIGLKLAGIQDWALLGVLTFFGTFIPYAGAIASAIPGLLLALTQSGDKFLAAAAVYLAVHIIEGYIVQPLVMKRAVVIRPAVLLIWQLVMGTLVGVLGIIVATPLLVCVQIAVANLYIERTLGKESEVTPETPGRKAA